MGIDVWREKANIKTTLCSKGRKICVWLNWQKKKILQVLLQQASIPNIGSWIKSRAEWSFAGTFGAIQYTAVVYGFIHSPRETHVSRTHSSSFSLKYEAFWKMCSIIFVIKHKLIWKAWISHTFVEPQWLKHRQIHVYASFYVNIQLAESEGSPTFRTTRQFLKQHNHKV